MWQLPTNLRNIPISRGATGLLMLILQTSHRMLFYLNNGSTIQNMFLHLIGFMLFVLAHISLYCLFLALPRPVPSADRIVDAGSC